MNSQTDVENEDGFAFGQTESLTTRLRGLIRDYPEGIGIVKELLQNADDSGAKSLHLIFDWRAHPADLLSDPRMAAVQGPALLAYNDRPFAEKDLRSIREIGFGGKARNLLATGRFGLGFNAVYNVTDWPGFVTGKRLIFFDPHRSAMVPSTAREPGHGWMLGANTWRTHRQLLEPYAAAGLPTGCEDFAGTIFRLPFRTLEQASRSEIKSAAFGVQNAAEIIEELLKLNEQLLLFLKHIEEFRVSEISAIGERREILTVASTDPDEVRQARQSLLQTLDGEIPEVLDRLESGDAPGPSVFTHRFEVTARGGKPERKAWQIVSGLFVDEEGELPRAARAMEQNGEKAVPWAGAAACIGGNHDAFTGAAYCSLPLPIRTGLPVHLHGFFDLDSSRSALTIAGGQTGTDRIRGSWNQLLLRHGVATAYARLIASLAPLLGENDPAMYYALWPGRVPNAPFDDLGKALAEQLFAMPVFRRAGDTRWAIEEQFWVLPEEWTQLQEPLVLAEEWIVDPILPAHVRAFFADAGMEFDEYTPEMLRDHLREEDFTPVPPDEALLPCLRRRDWLVLLLKFAVMDGDYKALKDVPLALAANGELEAFGHDDTTLYLAGEDEREIFAARPQWFLDAEYARECGLCEMPAAGVKEMTPTILIEELAELVSPEGDDESIPWAMGGAEPPNAAWLASVYQYLTRASTRGFQPDFDQMRALALVPARGNRLFRPGYPSTPLLVRDEIDDSTRAAFVAYEVPLLAAPPTLHQAISTFFDAYPEEAIFPLTGPDVVDTLHAHETLPECDDTMHRRLLDYLSDRRWLEGKEHGYDEARLKKLRQLPIFPTASGERVALDEQVYQPADLVCDLPVSLKLLDPGPDSAWSPLYRRLGVQTLDRAEFIRRGILPGYVGFNEETRLRALRWLRDHIDFTETDLEKEKGVFEELSGLIRATRLIRCSDGEYRNPGEVYDPRLGIVRDVLGSAVPIPDLDGTYAGSVEHWLNFFGRLGLRKHPAAADILRRIDELRRQASSEGTTKKVNAPIRRIYQHVVDSWSFLRKQVVPLPDGKRVAFEEALRGKDWLPVVQDPDELARFAAFLVPEDRLYRASEVCFTQLGHLAASQRPLFRAAMMEAERAVEFGFVPRIDLNTVFAHFEAAVSRWEQEGETLDAKAFENSLNNIYRRFEEVSKAEDEAPAEAGVDLIARFAGRPCLWHERRFWQPEHAFRTRVPFFGNRRVMIPEKRRHLYEPLGMRTDPEMGDFDAFIEEIAGDIGSAPVPPADRDNVMKVFHRLGQALADASPDSTRLVLTHRWHLMPAFEVFSPDAARFEERLDEGAIHLLHSDLRASMEGPADVRSLLESVVERPVNEFKLIDDNRVESTVRQWEEILRTTEFRRALERLIFHHDGKPDTSALDRLLDLHLELVDEIVTDLFVEMGGHEKRIGGGGRSPFYYSAEENTIYFAVTTSLRLKRFLAQVLEQVANALLPNLGPVEGMLESSPDDFEGLLDDYKIRNAFKAPTWDEQTAADVEAEPVEDSIDDADAAVSEAVDDEEELSNRPVPEPASDAAHVRSSDRAPRPLTGDETARSSPSGFGSSVGMSSPRGPHLPYRQKEPEHAPAVPSGRRHTPPPKPSQPKQSRIVSYVAPLGAEKRANAQDDGEANHSDKVGLGKMGVATACAYERARGRVPHVMGQTSPGYDIVSEDPANGTKRLIEVKANAGLWAAKGVGLSRTQHAIAMKEKDHFWLYVVEHAEEPAKAIVHPIQNPFEKIGTYHFDEGWRGLTSVEPPKDDSVGPRTGRRVAVDKRGEGTIANLEARGSLVLLTISFSDGSTLRSAYNPATMHLLD